MKFSLNHIRRLRLPMSAIVLSALFVWFITPNVRGTDTSTTYFNQGGDQIVLVLDFFKRNTPVQSVAKDYTYEPKDSRRLATVSTSFQRPIVIGTPSLKVLYSTVEINAP